MLLMNSYFAQHSHLPTAEQGPNVTMDAGLVALISKYNILQDHAEDTYHLDVHSFFHHLLLTLIIKYFGKC